MPELQEVPIEPAFVLQFRGEDGAIVDATIDRATPLGVDELRGLKDTPPKRLSIEIFSSEVSLNGDRRAGPNVIRIGGLDLRDGLYALVDQGWLPAPLVQGRVLMLDSNIVIEMGSLPGLAEGTPQFEGRNWWFRFLDNSKLTFNPLSYAMEGIARRPPSMEEFRALYRKGAENIRSVFPKAIIAPHTDETLRDAYGMLEALAARREREVTFLLGAGRRVWNTPRREERMIHVRQICHLAEQAGIQRGSLPVICALACLFPARGGQPPNIGLKVLKPKENYSQSDAHNALVDLRHIEMAAASRAVFGVSAPVLLTQDYWLALLWRSISPTGSHDGKKFDFNYVTHQGLFQTSTTRSSRPSSSSSGRDSRSMDGLASRLSSACRCARWARMKRRSSRVTSTCVVHPEAKSRWQWTRTRSFSSFQQRWAPISRNCGEPSRRRGRTCGIQAHRPPRHSDCAHRSLRLPAECRRSRHGKPLARRNGSSRRRTTRSSATICAIKWTPCCLPSSRSHQFRVPRHS